MRSNLERRNHLRRLPPDHYRHQANVHWINTIDQRKTGWLNPDFHHAFHEQLIHTCGRYSIACPAYCLMPDHIHLLLTNLNDDADQRVAHRFIRARLNALLHPFDLRLQRQAYDHVLRDEERSDDGFQKLVHYIRSNPVRAQLVQSESEWKFNGAIICGYPDLKPCSPNFHEQFWKIVQRLREQNRDS